MFVRGLQDGLQDFEALLIAFIWKQLSIFAPEIKESLTIVFKQKRERAVGGPFSFLQFGKNCISLQPFEITLYLLTFNKNENVKKLRNRFHCNSRFV